MKYREKAELLKQVFFKVNRAEDRWKNPEDLDRFLAEVGGRLKNDKKRRRGFLVCWLQRHNGVDLVAEVPRDFAEKAIVMDGFP